MVTRLTPFFFLFAISGFSTSVSAQDLVIHKTYVSSEQIKEMCLTLYNKIKSDNFTPDFLVGLSRGGLVPLGFLAGEQMFDNRATKILNLKSYTKAGNQTELKVLLPMHLEDLKDAKSLLIIDDMVDSGKTLDYVYALFKRTFTNAVIKTATLFYKTSSKIKPDYYVQETEDWIVFPWE